MLRIIVCLKVVMDPETPVVTFGIAPGDMEATWSEGVPPVLNPYDENCLEAALRIKDLCPSRVTGVSLGSDLPKTVLKKALAVGADDLVVLEDALFENLDGYSTAVVLAAAMKKIGEYDLILTGRMAADTNAGQVGLGIAEFLDIPSVSVARAVRVNGSKAEVERVTGDGYEVVEVPMPCLVTVSHELGELRSATVRGLTAARKQPFTTWHACDLGIELPLLRRSRLLRLFRPGRKVECQKLEGATAEAAAVNLALVLRELKLF